MVVPDFSHPSIVAFFAIAAIASGLALWKGGQPERYAAAVFLFTVGLQFLLYQLSHPRLSEVDAVSLLTDLILVTGFSAIALNAKRIWPLWAAALQLLSLSSHFPRFVDNEILAPVYAIMSSSPTGVVLLLMIVGTVGHQRRLAKTGHDPDWVDWNHARELRHSAAR